MWQARAGNYNPIHVNSGMHTFVNGLARFSKVVYLSQFQINSWQFLCVLSIHFWWYESVQFPVLIANHFLMPCSSPMSPKRETLKLWGSHTRADGDSDRRGQLLVLMEALEDLGWERHLLRLQAGLSCDLPPKNIYLVRPVMETRVFLSIFKLLWSDMVKKGWCLSGMDLSKH